MARRHGFAATYSHDKCRCDECRAAWAKFSRESAARHRGRVRAFRKSAECPDCGGPMSAHNGEGRDPKRCLSCARERIAAQHGTRSKYQAGCRCADCTKANRDAAREYSQRRRQEAA